MGELVKIEFTGPLLVPIGAATDLAVDATVAASGLIYLFQDWLRPYMDRDELEPVLEPWWLRFSGPFLYHPGRRYLPPTLRAFVDFVKAMPPWQCRRRTNQRWPAHRLRLAMEPLVDVQGGEQRLLNAGLELVKAGLGDLLCSVNGSVPLSGSITSPENSMSASIW